ncbi:MAG: hypothetical protein GX230_06300 [Lentisphaerae bacterium]|jgi:hypothetical protein|nr:hypothetical protein [Lentisphaerota bacterium]
MWSISKTNMHRMLGASLLIIGLITLSGCMSNPHEGDLPWSPTATWEGTPFLPGGMGGTY